MLLLRSKLRPLPRSFHFDNKTRSINRIRLLSKMVAHGQIAGIEIPATDVLRGTSCSECATRNGIHLGIHLVSRWRMHS